MDNRINEIRRQIGALRARMLETERSMHSEIAKDRDCSGRALKLMAQRVEMARLVGARRELGGLTPIGGLDLRKLRA